MKSIYQLLCTVSVIIFITKIFNLYTLSSSFLHLCILIHRQFSVPVYTICHYTTPAKIDNNDDDNNNNDNNNNNNNNGDDDNDNNNNNNTNN